MKKKTAYHRSPFHETRDCTVCNTAFRTFPSSDQKLCIPCRKNPDPTVYVPRYNGTKCGIEDPDADD